MIGRTSTFAASTLVLFVAILPRDAKAEEVIYPSTTVAGAYGTVPLDAEQQNQHRRAGFPLKIRRWALPSDTGSYVGYYVGGGCARLRKADPPTSHDGTWGWDYSGWKFMRRVRLGWWHGRRYQGGYGAYLTDGPSTNHGESGHTSDAFE